MGDCSLFLQTLNLDGEGWGRKKGRVQFQEGAEQAEYCEQGESSGSGSRNFLQCLKHACGGRGRRREFSDLMFSFTEFPLVP